VNRITGHALVFFFGLFIIIVIVPVLCKHTDENTGKGIDESFAQRKYDYNKQDVHAGGSKIAAHARMEHFREPLSQPDAEKDHYRGGEQ